MEDDKPPVIGVTGPDQGGGAAWLFTWFAVWLAGGHAVRITPKHPRSIEGLCGLIIGGGADVDPQLYGEIEADLLPREKQPDEDRLMFLLELILFPIIWIARKSAGLFASSGQDAARDALEWRLLDQAIQKALPVLGICRGGQLLNVYFGGTLHRDLKEFYIEDPEIRTVLPRKRILIEPESRLWRLLGSRPRRVNALHKHAIDRLGNDLVASAKDRNSIVQGIEHKSAPYLIGVQWHPEFLPQLKEQRELFCGLVREAKRCRTLNQNVEPRAQRALWKAL
jgi:putative glutamine amidotransferase